MRSPGVGTRSDCVVWHAEGGDLVQGSAVVSKGAVRRIGEPLGHSSRPDVLLEWLWWTLLDEGAVGPARR